MHQTPELLLPSAGCLLQYIKLFTSQSPLLTDVISCLDHVVIVECIPKSIVYHCINKLAVVHSVTKTSVHGCIRSHRHVLHTTCYNDVSIASLNHLSCHVNTVQTGTTNYVYCNSRCLDWKTSLQRCLTSYVLSKACLDNATHIYMIDLIGRNACSVQSLLDYDRT